MKDPRKPVGLAVKKRREELGLSQEALAEKASIHHTYVSGIERGIFNVSLVKLAQVANALGVKMKDLIGDL